MQAVIELEAQRKISWKGMQAVCFDKSDFGRRMQSTINQCNLDGPVAKAFFTALLLTRSPQRAEAAVMESIHLMNPDERFDEAILCGVIDASIGISNEAQTVSPEELQEAFAALPLELHGVLGFPADLRRCFVLRILLQLPREACARILNITTNRIDEYTCEALWSLPNAADPSPAAEPGCARPSSESGYR
jgi:hypothetical protein